MWWDAHVYVGTRFRAEISRQLQSAKCVVVLWSQASIESDWVIDEAEDGKNRGVLVQAIIDAAQPPHGFRGIQWANLNSWSGDTGAEEFIKLTDGISRHAPTPSPALASVPIGRAAEPVATNAIVGADVLTHEPERRQRRWRLAASAVALTSVIAVSIYLLSLSPTEQSSQASQPTPQDAVVSTPESSGRETKDDLQPPADGQQGSIRPAPATPKVRAASPAGGRQRQDASPTQTQSPSAPSGSQKGPDLSSQSATPVTPPAPVSTGTSNPSRNDPAPEAATALTPPAPVSTAASNPSRDDAAREAATVTPSAAVSDGASKLERKDEAPSLLSSLNEGCPSSWEPDGIPSFRFTLLSPFFQYLDPLVKVMKNNDRHLIVSGYGPEQPKQRPPGPQAAADAVRHYFVSQGISSIRLTAEAHVTRFALCLGDLTLYRITFRWK